MPPPRAEPLTYRIEGWVESIEGGQWIINGTVVNVNGATKLIDDPGLGWKVSAVSRTGSRGSYTALQIKALAPPEATPEPVEFTDFLQENERRVVDHRRHTCARSRRTTIEGDPQIGDLVSMKGERHQSEIWALRIAGFA